MTRWLWCSGPGNAGSLTACAGHGALWPTPQRRQLLAATSSADVLAATSSADAPGAARLPRSGNSGPTRRARGHSARRPRGPLGSRSQSASRILVVGDTAAGPGKGITGGFTDPGGTREAGAEAEECRGAAAPWLAWRRLALTHVLTRVVTRGRGGPATHRKPPSPPRGRERRHEDGFLWCGAVRAAASLFDVPRKRRVPTDQRQDCPFLWEIWVEPKSPGRLRDRAGQGQPLFLRPVSDLGVEGPYGPCHKHLSCDTRPQATPRGQARHGPAQLYSRTQI